MSLNTLLPLVSTIVSLSFAVVVLRRYVAGRRMYTLVWGIALLIYATGTFAEFYSSLAWSPTVFRLWYLCGAVLAAAWLGQGTVHLLIRKRYVAGILLGVLVAGTAMAALHVFSTPLNESVFDARVPLSEQYATRSAQGVVGIMPEGGVRSYSFVFNIYGTLALVGGALYSAYLFWRKRVLPNRVLGNVFIALGGLSPALGGTLARAGTTEFLYASELIGAIVIFIGFSLAVRQQPVDVTAAQTA